MGRWHLIESTQTVIQHSITTVAEVVLSVRDLPLMRDFFQETLGFSLFKELSFSPDGSIVPNGEPTITFLTICELDTPLGRNSHPQCLVLIDYRRHPSGRPGHDSSTSTLHHLAFEIPPVSYDWYLDRLSSLGLAPTEANFPDISARSLFFKDPEGNSIELICHAPL